MRPLSSIDFFKKEANNAVISLKDMLGILLFSINILLMPGVALNTPAYC